jgi:hypothetical protein
MKNCSFPVLFGFVRCGRQLVRCGVPMPPVGAHVRGEFGMMAVKRQERKIRKEKDAENVYARVRRIGKGSFGSVDLVQDKVRSELRGSPLLNLA